MKFTYLLPFTFVVLVGGSELALAADDGSPHSSSTMAAVGDAAITTTIKAKYLEDTRLKDSDVTVVTANGVVTLTGTAPSASASNAAEDLARHVKGVTNVNNQLVTPVATPSTASKIEDKTRSAAKATTRVVSDSWITTKVKSALLADSITKGFKISVKTRHHVVELSGEVDTQVAIDHAVQLVTGIKGVESVDSAKLTIEKP